VFELDDWVAHRLQLGPDLGGTAAFEREIPLGWTGRLWPDGPAGRIQCLLGVHAEGHQVASELEHCERLSIAAAGSVDESRLAIMQRHARRKRMAGSLARRDLIRIAIGKPKIATAVVQNDADLGHHEARTPGLAQTLDHRDDGPVAVARAKIHRVP